VVFALFISAVSCSYNFAAVEQFADAQWNCADISCSSKVSEGQFQPNYECAEFVSRSLINGGFIPNISPYASQSELEYYSYSGQIYDLLWVSSKQGPPLGLEDLLIVLGWTQTSVCTLPNVIMMTGSDGPYSHTGICIGNNLADAHNMAEYHQPPTGLGSPIDTIYTPPSSATSTQTTTASSKTSKATGTGASSKTSASGTGSSGSGSTGSGSTGTGSSSSSSSTESSSTGTGATGTGATGTGSGSSSKSSSTGTGSTSTESTGTGSTGTGATGTGSNTSGTGGDSRASAGRTHGGSSRSGCVMDRQSELSN